MLIIRKKLIILWFGSFHLSIPSFIPVYNNYKTAQKEKKLYAASLNYHLLRWLEILKVIIDIHLFMSLEKLQCLLCCMTKNSGVASKIS